MLELELELELVCLAVPLLRLMLLACPGSLIYKLSPLTPTSRNLPSNASSPTEWGPDLATGSLLAIPCLGV
ncbi:ORF154 [White spot syndrome virus]|uniref:ORF154 n=1 Tax=White spot syndrome virus TaxID=342409 RepID=A0A2D3I6K1_9VIRU|nr:ORF154 [White spot syndrome virus]